MKAINDYIDSAKNLPPAPGVLPKLLVLLHQPDIDSGKVIDLVSYDPSLTASVLRLCNSAYFGAAKPADDLHEAIMRIGFNQAYQITAAACGARALTPPQKGYGIETGELWKHSVATAEAAQLMAKDLGEDENVVFTAALLHDIGKIVLAQSLEDSYARIIEETETHQYTLLETEKKLLGAHHGEVGGTLLARWKFPGNLVAAVWFHHQPSAAKPYERLASFVYLGNLIAHFMGHGYGHQAFALRGRAEALDLLGLSPDSLPRYMIKTFEQLNAVESLFHVNA